MYIVTIKGNIDEDCFNKFKGDINRINQSDKQLKELLINIDSPGGEVDFADLFIYTIDRLSKLYSITLSAQYAISSSAFLIFMKARAKEKVVFSNTYSIIHEIDRDFSVIRHKRGDAKEIGLNAQFEKVRGDHLTWYRKIGLNDSEMQVVESGNDLYLNVERIRELL